MGADQMNEKVAELSGPESWALLDREVVGRLALITDDLPDIFPVNYKVDHGSVVFRTGEGSKFSAAVGHKVAFEADGYDVETATAWSVVLRGTATEVRLYDVLQVLVELPLNPWQPSQRPHVIKIWPDSITGRRFRLTGDRQPGVLPGPVLHAVEE